MLESSEESCEGFNVFRSFKANSYRIFGRPWSSRNNYSILLWSRTVIVYTFLGLETHFFHKIYVFIVPSLEYYTSQSRTLNLLKDMYGFTIKVIIRNDITTLASYDRHGSESILSPQCNSWKVIHFPLIIWLYKVCFWIFCNTILSGHIFKHLKPLYPRFNIYSSIKKHYFC